MRCRKHIKIAIIREHIPLEQGLRHDGALPAIDDCFIREHIPLEQGLRQF